MKNLTIVVGSFDDGYTPEQCGDTITIKELVEILSKYDDNAKIYVRTGSIIGYTYGSVRREDIEEYEDED